MRKIPGNSILEGTAQQWDKSQRTIDPEKPESVLKLFTRQRVRWEEIRIDGLGPRTLGIVVTSSLERVAPDSDDCRFVLADEKSCVGWFARSRCFKARKFGIIYSRIIPYAVEPFYFERQPELPSGAAGEKIELPESWVQTVVPGEEPLVPRSYTLFPHPELWIAVWEYELCPGGGKLIPPLEQGLELLSAGSVDRHLQEKGIIFKSFASETPN